MNKHCAITLNDQPKAIQLAVDLIQLLEENGIDNQVALDALEIVKQDFQRKINVNIRPSE
ncbi:MAG: DUF2496 domain-containing protein [Psychromonas sp.]|nr:DUF2496 domain-containing protein [Psychromonas sp.]